MEEQYNPSVQEGLFAFATCASPDGLKKGDALSSIVASQIDSNGEFSVLKSAQKIDHSLMRGGIQSLKLNPSALQGSQGSQKLLSLMKGYFSKNPFSLEFNVVDNRELLDAQKSPAEHRDLIVRVAGHSASFVELSKSVQDQVIALNESLWSLERERESPSDLSFSNQSAYVCDVQDFTVADGPGIRSTVFLQGCPLKCRWCCNPETQKVTPQYLIDYKKCDFCGKCYDKLSAKEVTTAAKRVLEFGGVASESGAKVCPKRAISVSSKSCLASELFERLKKNLSVYQSSKGGVTFSGGEPLLHSKFIHEFMTLARQHGISVGIETCGQFAMTPEIADILEWCEFIFYDLKAASSEVHRDFTGVGNERIVQNLKEIAAKHRDKMIVSIPLIPKVNVCNDEVAGLAQLMKSVGIRKARLLPYHSLGRGKYEKLGRPYLMDDSATLDAKEIHRLQGVCARSGIEQVTVE